MRRIEAVNQVQEYIGSSHGATRGHEMSSGLVRDILQYMDLPTDIRSKRKMLLKLVEEDVINTNQNYRTGRPVCGVKEMQQIHQHLKNSDT